ncbi:MAG: hypothetical protein R2752_05665 [Vicinamibacterales bacterium]
MTCVQLRAYCDAVPLDEWSAERLTAARHHADACAGCRDTLAFAGAIGNALADLPGPAAAPEGLAAGAMARIARLEDARSTDEARAAADLAARADRRRGVFAVVGQAAGAAMVTWALRSGGAGAGGGEFGGGGLASSLTDLARHLPVVVTAAWGAVVFVVSLLIPLRQSAR